MRGNGPAPLRECFRIGEFRRLPACLRVALAALLFSIAAGADGASAPAKPVGIVLGRSIVALNGPWMFHVGDNPCWAQPGFDDSGWEHVDLTPAPGATDGDVGIGNYVPGWTAKGHPHYHGFAWYRIRLNVKPPEGESLALLGPWAVDSAYRIFANGVLLGGVGDFSDATPKAYGYHYPRMFELPPQASGGPIVVAIRVWLGPWAAPGSGGVHVAPAIGARDAVVAQYRLQWLKIVEGYAVDAVPALLFFLCAAVMLCLIPFDPGGKTYLWLAIALMLSGIQRGNQAFFFWWQIETIQDFVIFIAALTGSLTLGAWLMAWRSWFRLDRPAWLPWAVAALTVALMVAQLLAAPWLFGMEFPRTSLVGLRYAINAIRLAYLLALASIVFLGLRREGREGWVALPAVLASAAVLFPAELTAVGLPGIWFPWGVGLSLGECASVALVVLLCVPILRRLWSHAPRGAAVLSRA